MDDQPRARDARFRRRILTFGIVTVLLALFAVPIAIILIGGGAAAISGLIVLGVLIAFQLPAFMLLKWLGVLPSANRNDTAS